MANFPARRKPNFRRDKHQSLSCHFNQACRRCYFKQEFNTEGEILNSIKYIGYIPGILKTSKYSKQKIYYVKSVYLQPSSPSFSTKLKRVVTEFYSHIDKNMAKFLGLEDHIGIIPTGPDDAVDVNRIGLVICMIDDNPSSAREIIQNHVFRGVVAAKDIYVEEMKRIKTEVI